MQRSRPPHHLTWWNEGALTALAKLLDLDVVEISRAEPHQEHAVFCWMAKFIWIDRAGRYYANKLSWHLNFLFGLPMAALAAKFLGLPKNAQPIDIVLVARKTP